MSKKIYYWAPFISSVATVQAVIKSAESFNLYSRKKYTPHIINVAGEWNSYKINLYKKDIKIINLTKSKIIDNKKHSGFLKSRILYIYIFLISIVPLSRLLKKNPPDFFVAQLITSLPLFINYVMKFKTKFILRISGLPKLNLLRLFFWKLSVKNIYALTCPTNETKNYLVEKNFIDKSKLFTLYDPIISSKEIMIKVNNSKKDKSELKNTFLSIGRLTKQKNFSFLISNFKKFNDKKNYNLLIVGEGEDCKKLNKLIKKQKLSKSIKIIGYQSNVYNYLKNCKCFIMTSLWEDPGFVLVEAAYAGIPIISSNCMSGPKEILNYGKNGLIFETNNSQDFIEKMIKFDQLSVDDLQLLKINAKKKSKEFSIFNHFKNFKKILN